MPEGLVPCPACRRHVHTRERTCPFCSVGLPDDLSARLIPGPVRRLSRGKLFAFATTLAATTSIGCGDGSSTTNASPPYGHPPFDSNVDTAAPGDTSDAADGVDAVDVGDGDAAADSDADADTGGGGALYGDPPPDGSFGG